MKKTILLSAIALSLSTFASAQNSSDVQTKAAAKKEAVKQADTKKEKGKTSVAGTDASAGAKAKKAEMKNKDAQKEKGHTTQKTSADVSKAAADKKAELKARDAQKEKNAKK